MPRLLLALFLAALLPGCATTDASDPRDPWESFNRKSFELNQQVDRAVLRPAAEAYVEGVPAFAREGVNNFYGNLEDVGTSLNNFLQGKPAEGLSDAGRFVVNTVLGVFGLWDVATPMGLEKHVEDFGQTLGRWGVRPGPYLVLPLFGPSTLRDAPARAVDPSWYYDDWIDSDGWYAAFMTLDLVRTRANLLGASGILSGAALDEYTFTRDAWLQRRRSQVYDGRPPREKEEEFD